MPADTKEGRFSGMTTRQKVMIGAFVIVVLIIIWQIKGLFGGGGEATAPPANITPAAKTTGAMSAATPQQAAIRRPGGAPVSGIQSVPQGPAVNTYQPQQMDQQLRQEPVSMSSQLMEVQKQTEQKYIEQLNQLQTLKIQREIAETNQAIAAARLATVTAEKNVTELLTKPSQPQQPQPIVPAGAYSNVLTNPVLNGASVATAQMPPAQMPPTGEVIPPPPLEVSYTVISVSMELGKWNAVLGYQGKLYSVSVGDKLPADGSSVVAISKNGVTLSKGGKHRKISLISSI